MRDEEHTLWGCSMTPVKSLTILLAMVICCGRTPVHRPPSARSLCRHSHQHKSAGQRAETSVEAEYTTVRVDCSIQPPLQKN